MYAFVARLPVDHVLAAVRLIRSDRYGFSVPELLKLIGAATGEVGALMAAGPIFFVATCDELSLDEAVEQLESIEFNVAAAEPNFDPTPWIPVILLIIELILKRRQG